jgi:hypothetical protein
MAQTEDKIEHNIKRNLGKGIVIPLLHQANNNLLQLSKIPHNSMGMVLIQALDDLSIPLDLGFVLG